VHLRVVTWNLMHGRSLPPSRHELLDEFGAALESWEWDVALLQEVPPWWTETLARRLSAEYRQALTSRNAVPQLRRTLARRWPELMRSGGGGANAIIARRDRIVSHHVKLLTGSPERRVAHGVLLGCGLWVVNLHATAHDGPAAARDGTVAADVALQWARDEPLVFGGDFNLREPHWPGLAAVAGHDVDHIFIAGGLEAISTAEMPHRGTLSDHAPVAVELRLTVGESGDEANV
jgi:endonuclease/exonuclease/phosphatase family metal-dependent hydrolase